MTIQTIGLDLAKHIFHVHGVDATGQVVVSRALPRVEVSRFFANLSPCRAHYQHLRDTGKPPKVALVACMRKLLVIMNAILKTKTPWRFQTT